jgi:transposase InsO family protein
VEVDGQLSTALLDTGSTVSTIAQSFYRDFLYHLPISNIADLLNIQSAGGHSLPYLGYIEAGLKIPGDDEEQNCLFLVVPDTEYSKRVPVLIGTNILLPLINNQRDKHGIRYIQENNLGSAWAMTFKNIHLQNKSLDRSKGYLCQLKNDGPQEVKIPANTAITLYGKPHHKVSYRTCCGVITESAKTGNGLQELEISPLLVSYDFNKDDRIPVLVSNPTTKTLIIPPHAVICEIHHATVVSLDKASGETDSSSTTEDWMSHFKLEESMLTSKDVNSVKKFLHSWKDIFSQNDLDVGFTNLVSHGINLTNEIPFKQRHRRIPPSMYSEVKDHLQQLLDAGIIRPSHSPWASNMVLVRKKDNSLRICVDYRQMNERTIRDAYYLPRIDEMLDCMSGNSYFSILDMKSGYHQIEVKEEHKNRTAFTAGPLGFWEYNRLPFGLCNAPATYQRAMEQCLGDLNYNICLVYLDDVIIFSKTYEEHLQRLEAVFKKLREYGLKLSPKKCQFFKEKVKYIGHIVSENGIEPDPDKIKKIVDWERPTDVSKVRQFLGFAGYYRKFVKDFAKIARPLNDLLIGDQPKKRKKVKKENLTWNWTSKHEDAFQQLKDVLTKPPILGYPDFSLPFELHTDASTEGLGGVLCQEQEGKMRVIAFASRGLSNSEKNYSAYKLEFLALKWAVTEKFHDYLYGSPFTVLTDNNPLTYILTNAKLDATGHRWLAALATYNFSIKYRPGARNKDADAMSRLPGTEQEISSDSIKAIHDSTKGCFLETISMNINLVQPNCNQDIDTTTHNWEQLQREDPLLKQLIHLVKNGKKITAKEFPENSKEWQLYSKEFSHLVWHRDALHRQTKQDDKEHYQLILPESCRQQALHSLHDQMGHLGRDRTLHLVRDRFYWPKMAQDVENYIKNCERCIKRKSPTNDRPPLVSIKSTQPLELVCIDYLTLEMSKGGFQHILVITDHFTKYAVAIPTRNQTARTTAEALWNGFVVHYGFPYRIHSDQGANFCSKLIKELCELGGIKKSRTTPYNPAGNGLTERMNRTLLNMLGTLEPKQKQDWKSHVAPIVHAYNCTRHQSTGYSPFQLMFGRQPRLPIDTAFGLHNNSDTENYTQYMESLRNRLESAYSLAAESAREAQVIQKSNYDLKARAAILDIGDRVLIKALAFEGKHKLADRWEEEPYVVIEHPNTEIPVYILKPENGVGRKRTLHRKHLLPIGSIPIEIQEPQKPEPTFRRTRRTRHHESSSSSSDEDLSTSEPEEEFMIPTEDAESTGDAESTRKSDDDIQESEQDDVEEEQDQDESEIEDEDEVQDLPPAEPEHLRRSTRPRRPPEWIRSGEYVVSRISCYFCWSWDEQTCLIIKFRVINIRSYNTSYHENSPTT